MQKTGTCPCPNHKVTGFPLRAGPETGITIGNKDLVEPAGTGTGTAVEDLLTRASTFNFPGAARSWLAIQVTYYTCDWGLLDGNGNGNDDSRFNDFKNLRGLAHEGLIQNKTITTSSFIF